MLGKPNQADQANTSKNDPGMLAFLLLAMCDGFSNWHFHTTQTTGRIPSLIPRGETNAWIGDSTFKDQAGLMSLKF